MEELNVFKLPVDVSIDVSLLFVEEVKLFKLDVEVSNAVNLLFCVVFVPSLDDV